MPVSTVLTHSKQLTRRFERALCVLSYLTFWLLAATTDDLVRRPLVASSSLFRLHSVTMSKFEGTRMVE